MNQNRQNVDHQRPVTYEMKPPKPAGAKPNPAELFVHMMLATCPVARDRQKQTTQ